jgi:hypothetical protein
MVGLDNNPSMAVWIVKVNELSRPAELFCQTADGKHRILAVFPAVSKQAVKFILRACLEALTKPLARGLNY